MTDEAEAGDVGARVDGAGWQRMRAPRRRHGSRCASTAPLPPRGAAIDAIELDRGADEAGAERLGEEQHVAGAGAGVGQHARGIDRAGHRIAELDFAGRARCGRRAATTPASRSLSKPPRKMSRIVPGSSPSSGNAAIASAVSGRPPIA